METHRVVADEAFLRSRLARLRADEAAHPSAPRGEDGRANCGTFDLDGWIREHAPDAIGPEDWHSDSGRGRRWEFKVCPWNQEHRDSSAFILELPSGAISAGCHHNGCIGRDWHALRDLREPGWRERAARANGPSVVGPVIVDVSEDAMTDAPQEPNWIREEDEANRTQTPGDPAHPERQEWKDPIEFATMALPGFPVDALPSWQAEHVAAVAETTQTPPDVAACMTLAGTSAAVGGAFEIEVRPDWRETLAIFTAAVLPPGERKSAVVSLATRPFESWEQEENRKMAPAMAEAHARREVLAKAIKRSEDEAAKASGPERDELVKKVSELHLELAGIKVAPPPRKLADDATPESIASLLHVYGGRIAILSAEGGVLEMMAGRYTDWVPNLDVYLKGHAGDAIRVDRKGRPSEYIPRPVLTIGITIQPDVLSSLNTKPGFHGRGLLARFLYSLPTSNLGARDCSPACIPPNVARNYMNAMNGLFAREVKYNPEGWIEPYVVPFSGGAQAAHATFRELLEPRLGPAGDLRWMSEWAGKYAGAVARIAGLLHLAEYNPACPVEPATVERAIRIGKYFLEHSKAALKTMGQDPALIGAKAILEYLKKNPAAETSRRDLHRALDHRFKKVEEIDPSINVLIEYGWFRDKPTKAKNSPGRRGSPVYLVHPKLRGQA